MSTTEHTINDVIAECLRSRKASWRQPETVQSEALGAFRNGRRPDILVVDAGVSPVVIETELMPAATVEQDALSRLGETVAKNGKKILTSIAVRLPVRLRELSSTQLSTAIEALPDIEYCIYSGSVADDARRWPLSGWLVGDLDDLAIAAQSGSVPEVLILDAADKLERSITSGAMRLQDSFREYPAAASQIAGHLQQAEGEQTYKMAIAILADALVFHESLAGRLKALPDLRSLEQLRGASALSKGDILQEWHKILQLNYWPVFDIARRILESVPTSESTAILESLAETAVSLVGANLYRTYDLTGTVFQRLISDREFLAAYYTTPASATLMAGLLFPRGRDLPTGPWADDTSLTSLRIGDFACGTGTLLSTLYVTLSRAHELSGGNGESLHRAAMNDVLYGYDILPTAAHLTASALSGINPGIHYGKSNIYTLAYGLDSNGGVALGSVDLLDASLRIATLFITSERLMADGVEAVDPRAVTPVEGFHVIAMNPPFKRPTGNEGESKGKVNPMFAGFGNSDEAQAKMTVALNRLTSGTSYNGQAGLASAFIELGDRRLSAAGRLGLILPLTFASGDSWEMSRDLLRERYSRIRLISIVGDGKTPTSFSADTGMAECMVIAEKSETASTRAVFISLFEEVQSVAVGEELARQVERLNDRGAIARLEDGPSQVTHLMIGSETVGAVLDAPLSENGSWPLTRIKDFMVAQAAYQLMAHGLLWLPTMPEAKAFRIPVAELGDFATIGPYHMKFDRKYGGAFDIRDIPEGHAPSHPILWAHDANHERTIAFEAQQEGLQVAGKLSESEEMWATATHLHFNRDFRLNSQSTAFQFSRARAMGGRAWISVGLQDIRHEQALALWGNTTLGILLHWFVGNRQQSGRVGSGVAPLRRLPTLDVTALSEQQLAEVEALFVMFADQPLERAHLLAGDEVRTQLDAAFLVRVLGVPQSVVEPDGALAVLRRKLSLEPSIHGGIRGARQKS